MRESNIGSSQSNGGSMKKPDWLLLKITWDVLMYSAQGTLESAKWSFTVLTFSCYLVSVTMGDGGLFWEALYVRRSSDVQTLQLKVEQSYF